MLYEVSSWIAEEVEGKIKFVDHNRIATWWVDADAGNCDSAFLEFFIIPSKADQLPIAVRSPVTSVEDEHQGSFDKLAAQIEGLSLFVR